MGGVLNNSRLLLSQRYHEQGLKGDFSILLLIFLVVNSSIMLIFLNLYGEGWREASLFFLTASVLLLLTDYGRVAFRLMLDYRSITMESFYLMGGYGLGILLYQWYREPALIFVMGYGTSFLYLYWRTKIYREPMQRTFLFNTPIRGVNGRGIK